MNDVRLSVYNTSRSEVLFPGHREGSVLGRTAMLILVNTINTLWQLLFWTAAESRSLKRKLRSISWNRRETVPKMRKREWGTDRKESEKDKAGDHLKEK